MSCKNSRWQFSTTLHDTVGASTGNDNASPSSAVGLKTSLGGRYPGKCKAVAELGLLEGAGAWSVGVAAGSCSALADSSTPEGLLTSGRCWPEAWGSGSLSNAWMLDDAELSSEAYWDI